VRGGAGHDTLALDDRHGVYGAPRFFTAAWRAGVRALVGAEVTLLMTASAHSTSTV
jgi:DNA polymerase III alpha subunit